MVYIPRCFSGPMKITERSFGKRAEASFKKQERNTAMTEFVGVPGRGHALTIDSGWRDVADIALQFIQRYVK